MNVLILVISLTMLTVMMHSICTYVAIGYYKGAVTANSQRPWVLVTGTMACLVIFLLIVHLLEAALWAAALFWWQALPDFSTALYYSLTSYSAVGYGDVLLPESARLLGPVESVVGVLMLGWSTAVIVAVVRGIFGEITRIG